MVDFREHISPDLIICNLCAKNREQAIEMLVNRIFDYHPEVAGKVSRKEAFDEVMKREKLQTTGLGEAMAFPHARISGWKKFVIVLGYDTEGIDFHSLDERRTHLVCLMISPEETPYSILKSMSGLIKFLGGVKDIKTIFMTDNPDEIAAFFRDQEVFIEKTIQAQDIMKTIKIMVRIHDPIDKIVRLMHLGRIDVLPVVDDEQRLIGQISCFDIFDHEIPDFFKQLHTVSFVRNIDPFEKFFQLKKSLTVKDFFTTKCEIIRHDATLLEVLFLLTIKNHQRLFVIRDEKLTGVIDRFTILDRILFF